MMVAISNCRTSATKSQQLTLAAFLKPSILAIGIHGFSSPKVIKRLGEKIADFAFESAASHDFAVGLDGEMTIAAVATVINDIRITFLRDFEESFFI